MKCLVVAGHTATAGIPGISAAGADAELLVHTPAADLEILAYGRPVWSPVVPVSPDGCPTPAVVTRAVRERVGFDVLAIDAGLARPTAAPTVDVGSEPGGDVRESVPVPNAASLFEEARELAADLPVEELLVGETIPGGTTTALGVLSALGERETVSSSLPTNPVDRKRCVVEEALAASALEPGELAGSPLAAVSQMGDPVLATVAGIIVGASDAGTEVTLAGGSQLAAAAGVARHAGVDAPLELATTSFLAADETCAIESLAAELSLELTVTDPEFDALAHPLADAYREGAAKEGVAMGGALAVADHEDVSMAAIRERSAAITDDLLGRDASVRP